MNINEQVRELRIIANNLSIGHNMSISLAMERFREAADTIESLSTKLMEANRELSFWRTYYINEKIELRDMGQIGERYNRWIPISEKKPECSGYYEVTIQSEVNGEVVRITEQRCYHKDVDFFASLIDPEFAIDEKVIAWRNMPKPYDERSAEDCSGWILCKDRTPEKEGLYIIHVITGTGEDYVGTWIYQRGVHLSGEQTYIDDRQGYWASPYSGDPVNKYLTQNVVAWQPMPEPYHEP